MRGHIDDAPMGSAVLPAAATTSLQRTYRYLRIGLAGSVVTIFVSVGVAAADVGWLTSLSDYYYTSARNGFVGALVAASLALLALSGRGIERGLLDVAALCAPLIALVPTTVGRGDVPGVDVSCPISCFPADHEADAATGVITYLVTGALIVIVALVLVGLREASVAGIGATLAVAIVVLAAVASTWILAREAFLQHAHFVATVAFFALFAVVAVRNAFPRREAPPTRVFRSLYVGIAVLLGLVLVAFVALTLMGERTGVPTVLLAEASALVLFFAFWVVEGVERWNDIDPRLR